VKVVAGHVADAIQRPELVCPYGALAILVLQDAFDD
jgi:hypothetical protein